MGFKQQGRPGSTLFGGQSHTFAGRQFYPDTVAAVDFERMGLMCLQNIAPKLDRAIEVFTEKHRCADFPFQDVPRELRRLPVQNDAFRTRHYHGIRSRLHTVCDGTRDLAMIGHNHSGSIRIEFHDAPI